MVVLKLKKKVAIDLRKQIELENPDLKQQINSIGRLETNEVATKFLIIEKTKERTFNFSQVLWVSYKKVT